MQNTAQHLRQTVSFLLLDEGLTKYDLSKTVGLSRKALNHLLDSPETFRIRDDSARRIRDLYLRLKQYSLQNIDSKKET